MLFGYKKIEDILDEIKKEFNRKEGRIGYLEEENKKLKDESYKDNELQKMKAELEQMKDDYYRGFPISEMNVVRVLDSDDWIVDYDRNRGMYRVSHFEDNHFKDECWFDAYEEKEVNNKIDKVVNTLEGHKLNFKEYFSKNKKMSLGSSGLDYYFENLINWIKEL